jgi:hypothetical protein
MNNNGKYTLIFAIFIACILLTGIAVAEKKGGGGGGSKPECNDKIDNDGDGYADMKDDGCSNRKDKDETNCGDGECEGGETCSSCSTDCGSCYQNNCTETDGGYVPAVKGYTYGMYNGETYDYADYCQSSANLIEYYCSGNLASNYAHDCNGTTSCINGACI